MTSKEKIDATNRETQKHIDNVGILIGLVITLLGKRAADHDRTKMEDPELDLFVECTSQLANCTYGSEEYKGFLAKLKPALDHHYARNRHHPEHFENGVNDMTLIDLVEMICDWKAATLRHQDGNILKSIDHNAKRFGLDEQLCRILRNTVQLFEEVDGLSR